MPELTAHIETFGDRLGVVNLDADSNEAYMVKVWHAIGQFGVEHDPYDDPESGQCSMTMDGPNLTVVGSQRLIDSLRARLFN